LSATAVSDTKTKQGRRGSE